MTIDVAILGASGYTALELAKILLRHPNARVVAVTSRDEEQPAMADVHPSLTGRLDLRCEPFDPDTIAAKAQCVFCALPHGASMAAVRDLLARGVRVIDLSADYRLRDPNVYAEWYGASHADTENLEHAVYGLPELWADEISKARLIANPGCYPTSAILGLAPLLAAGDLIDPKGIIVDSKSGVTGAGRTPKLMTHFPECNENVEAYNVGWHRHTPEIEQILSDVSGTGVEVIFTPHLIPMDRGIFTTSYAPLQRTVDEKQLLEIFRDFYRGKPFVRVIEHLPATKDTVGSNFLDVTVRVVRQRAVVMSCEDNLLKGASGAAVQNFNLMFGFPETTALL
ncbi:N-acetyl-gamma-glutamyl-phosphate reductase [Planctomycetes bacterium Pan216]|uniref:N-acetyl-gamma-glutamyl-phosphate reductase n=1 Tax=Kolteria novifilia TaxID=2527975 RepID=A0A518BBN7_9BACT|nr:N-acetyl-gamma-glutamyl-phosphate reductase [Planctomycetes bacterium Pan216]